jgi:hypothetical protein
MKNLTLGRKWFYLLTICVLIQLFSCQSKIKFKLFSKMPIPVSESIVGVKYFRLRYNPQAYHGAITIYFSNGDSIKANSLKPDQVSSLLVLLNSPGLKYDRINSEFVLQ